MAATHARPGPKTEKPWRHAIQKAVKELIEVEIDGKPQKIRALNAMARRLVKKGWQEGDISALKEAGDRLDGKPVQGVELGVSVKITRIEHHIVVPKATEGPIIEGQAVEVSQAIESNRKAISPAKE